MTFGTIARCLGDTEHGITAVKMPSLMSLATKVLRTLFILYIILCALLYTFEPYLWILRLRLWPPEKSNSTKHGCSDAADIPHTRYHTGFKLGFTTIYGYPQKGGLYALPHALGVDFDFLGLDRFGSIGSKDEEIAPSDEEEVFCNKMRQLGARWWPDWGLYHRHSRRTVSHDGVLYIGWPSSGGGVWVLHIDPMDMHFEKKPWGIIYNALSMDERCQIIEKLGGKFYPDPKTCPFHESLFTQKVRGEVDESAK